MPVHRIELAMIAIRKGGNVIKKDAGIEGRLRFQIPENDHRVFTIAGSQEKFFEGVAESGNKEVLPIAKHQDQIGFDMFNDMLPTDAVIIEHGIIVIFDAGACLRRHVVEGGF